MDSPQDRAFRAVLNFVSDLWSVFSSSEISPLALYNRLTGHVKFSDKEAIKKFLGGYFMFFSLYETEVVNGTMHLPSDARITYSDKVFIDIGRLHSRADADTKKAIRNHLLNISTIMAPTDEKRAKLQEAVSGITTAPRTSSTEGESSIPLPGLSGTDNESKFVKSLLSDIESAAKSADTANPAAAMASLFSNGKMGDIFNSIQTKVESGELNVEKFGTIIKDVVGSFTGMMGSDSSMGSMFGGLASMFGSKGAGHGTAAALIETPVVASADEVRAALAERATRPKDEEIVVPQKSKNRKTKSRDDFSDSVDVKPTPKKSKGKNKKTT